jgi:hypothetical protein
MWAMIPMFLVLDRTSFSLLNLAAIPKGRTPRKNNTRVAALTRHVNIPFAFVEIKV